MFQRSWLFIKKYFEYILVLNALLFVIGFTVHLKYATALKIPLLHQLSFLILTVIFRRYYRNQKPFTLWLEIVSDGIFNFIFVILLGIFVILVL